MGVHSGTSRKVHAANHRVSGIDEMNKRARILLSTLLLMIIGWVYAGIWSYPREVTFNRWHEEILTLQMHYYPQYAPQREFDRKQRFKICYVFGPICVLDLWMTDDIEQEKQ